MCVALVDSGIIESVGALMPMKANIWGHLLDSVLEGVESLADTSDVSQANRSELNRLGLKQGCPRSSNDSRSIAAQSTTSNRNVGRLSRPLAYSSAASDFVRQLILLSIKC